MFNWKRGLLRLWVVLSGCWIVFSISYLAYCYSSYWESPKLPDGGVIVFHLGEAEGYFENNPFAQFGWDIGVENWISDHKNESVYFLPQNKPDSNGRIHKWVAVIKIAPFREFRISDVDSFPDVDRIRAEFDRQVTEQHWLIFERGSLFVLVPPLLLLFFAYVIYWVGAGFKKATK